MLGAVSERSVPKETIQKIE